MLTRLATRSPPTSAGLTKCVMPKRSPQAFFSGLRSTPMIMSAPTRRRPWMTFNPMPPSPNTMHLAPGSTFAVFDAGRHAAADVAHLVEWRVFADFGNGDFRQNRKIGEGRTTHIVVKFRPADREARHAVRHDALPLRRANGGAEVGFPRQAGRAIAALGRVERNDMVAFFDRGHAGPTIDDHARTL